MKWESEEKATDFYENTVGWDYETAKKLAEVDVLEQELLDELGGPIGWSWDDFD